LTDTGYVILKENTVKNVSFVMDRDDCSVTRSDHLFKQIFAQSQFELVKEAAQTKFPKPLFPVKMYALQKKKKQ